MDMIADVISRMSTSLSKSQLEQLKIVLTSCLQNYDVSEKVTDLTVPFVDQNEVYLKQFLAWKYTEGISDSSISTYRFAIEKVLQGINLPVNQITENHIFTYLAWMKMNGSSMVYLNNTRQYCNCFFNWLYSRRMISKNPMESIKPIKEDKKLKEELSEVQVEKIKRATTNTRDLSMIEILYSTGVRVSELVNMKKKDIDFNNNTIKVKGKGNKDRFVYMSSTANFYLTEYLESRTDDCEYVWIQNRNPIQKLKVSGVQAVLTTLGQKCSISKLHPHRFRRTCATNLLRKGMPIEKVSKILGHESIETTMVYCNINQSDIRNDYMRIMNS